MAHIKMRNMLVTDKETGRICYRFWEGTKIRFEDGKLVSTPSYHCNYDGGKVIRFGSKEEANDFFKRTIATGKFDFHRETVEEEEAFYKFARLYAD